LADRIPVKAKYAPGSPVDVIALQEFEPTDTLPLDIISGFSVGVTAELALNSITALSDVNTLGSPAPVNGEVLAWNSTSGMWEPTLSPGSSFAIWGNITGILSDQTDLQSVLDLKADQTSLDTHTNDATIHFTEAGIDHTNILNIGTNTHVQIDTHLADTIIHYSDAPADTQEYVRKNNSWVVVTHATFGEYKGGFDASSGSFPLTQNQGDWFNVTSAGTIDAQVFIIGDVLISLVDAPSTTTFAGNWTIVPNVSVTDHTQLTNIGTNTHVQIDTHISDGTTHFTEASIDHTNILNVGTNTHVQIDTHIADATIHFTTLDGLIDVNAPTPADGDALVWNNTSSMWEPSTAGVAVDELVKVSATDTTAGYLSTELVAGGNITLTVQNPGADEKLEIAYDKGGMPYIATIGGNDMVVFDDTTRANKTLSAESQVLNFAESALSNNDWMQIQHATDADTGYVMPFNGTIVSIAMHCENTNGVSKAINYYFDGTIQGIIASFVGNVNEEVINTMLNADFTAGTKIRLRGGTGGTIQDINIQIRVKWRL